MIFISMRVKKVFIIIGTRPEAIKMAPIINKLKSSASQFEPLVCVTAQHREMLDQVLQHFHIIPDYDFDIMTKGQDIFDLTSKILRRLKPVMEKEMPAIVLVQGDTTTAFVGGLAAFYLHIPIGHVEAGLRTYKKESPFPEEINRHLIGVLADYHFAPTEKAKMNLLSENINRDQVWVTGNPVIDSLLWESDQEREWGPYFRENWNLSISSQGKRNILVTGHRRESFGRGFENICIALKNIAERNPDVNIIYPVHLNPNVKTTVHDILGGDKVDNKNVFLLDPLEYSQFVWLMKKSYLILTDSGGIQEEAPSLGKPVLVMRDTTERPEGIEAGTCKLVGTNTGCIVMETEKLLLDTTIYTQMAGTTNPYGDGKTSDKILSILSQVLK